MNIAVINESTVVGDAVLARMVAAVQKQIDQDWSVYWGLPGTLHFVLKGQAPPVGLWWLAVLDDVDQAGVLGYHDLTSAGLPLGKVFAKTTLTHGGLVSVTLSHEVLEILADPVINWMIASDDQTRLYSVEVCDPVQADGHGYDIVGVRVSNFCTPYYYQPAWEQGQAAQPYDFRNLLRAPVPALLGGGYQSYLDLTTGRWDQVFADLATDTIEGGRLRHPADLAAAFQARPHAGSRRYRRQIPFAARLRSTREAA